MTEVSVLCNELHFETILQTGDGCGSLSLSCDFMDVSGSGDGCEDGDFVKVSGGGFNRR